MWPFKRPPPVPILKAGDSAFVQINQPLGQLFPCMVEAVRIENGAVRYVCSHPFDASEFRLYDEKQLTLRLAEVSK